MTTTTTDGARSTDDGNGEAGRDHDADRRLDELLQENRVVLPGTTVLFGFLLTMATSPTFRDFDDGRRATYFVAFVASAVALVFLLAEASYHRLRGRPYDKRVMLRTASRQSLVAMVFLAVALTASVALVAELTYGGTAAVVVSTSAAVVVALVWFGLPLRRRYGGEG